MKATAFHVFAGTAAGQADDAVHRLWFDTRTGALTAVRDAAPLYRPGFLCLHPRRNVLYAAAGRRSRGEPDQRAVHAYRLDRASGELIPLNAQSADEAAFCHISTARDGRLLMGADYAHGLAAVFPVRADGSLGAVCDVVRHTVSSGTVPDRQQRPHLHSIQPDPSGTYALVCDFSADRVVAYRLDPAGRLLTPQAADTVPGDGPRHLACHPGGRWVYVVNELSSTVASFAFDPAHGRLRMQDRVSMLPGGYAGDNTAAEILLSGDGRLLYASNRGHDSVAWFRTDARTGRLVRQGIVPSGGAHPRNMVIDPTGGFLLVANRDSDCVAVFRLDPDSGAPEPTGHAASLSMPMCLRLAAVQG